MKLSIPTPPLQWKITALVVAVVVFSGLVAGYFTSQALTHQIDDLVGERLLGLARMVADEPEVRQAFRLDRPAEVLQPLAEKWMEQTKTDLIVIFNMDTIRYAHPNKDLLDKHFTGDDEGPALRGQEYVSKAVGISGPSMRAFAPIYDDGGRQIGVVVVGTWMDSLNRQVQKLLGELAVLSLIGLAVGIAGAAAVALNIKASLLGLEPTQIKALLEERVAILQSIREGVIAVDRENRITLINKEAERLIGFGQEMVGKPVTDVLPYSRLPNVVASNVAEFDQEQIIRGTSIITNRVPITVGGKVMGAVATFRDMSEVRELASELTGVKQLAEALRAQAHEFVNRLHTVSGLLQLGRHEDAIQYIASVTRTHEELVGFVASRIHDPAIAGLLLGKISAAHERGINLSLDPDSHVPVNGQGLKRIDLVTVIGNLLENALDAVSTQEEGRRDVWISLYSDDSEMLIEVEDAGPGIARKDLANIFNRGFTTKEGNKGLGLYLIMRELDKIGGTVEVDSRVGVGSRFTVHLPRSLDGC